MSNAQDLIKRKRQHLEDVADKAQNLQDKIRVVQASYRQALQALPTYQDQVQYKQLLDEEGGSRRKDISDARMAIQLELLTLQTDIIVLVSFPVNGVGGICNDFSFANLSGFYEGKTRIEDRIDESGKPGEDYVRGRGRSGKASQGVVSTVSTGCAASTFVRPIILERSVCRN